jgi:two-component system OmpR family response regulator
MMGGSRWWPSATDASKGRLVRVLVVEDERGLAETVRRGLSSDGFVVDVVHDGQDAVWAVTENSYDVMVLDIMIPGLNGYRVIEELRRRENWTPILMLTAKDGEYDQSDALDLGADDYLTKPFSFVVLIARLRALVRRGAPERPVIIAAGDLTLDAARRQVHRGGQSIDLTPREFGLLFYLMRHRGDIVTKSAFLDNVWDPAFEGDPNVVEVYVRYLRRKIDLPFDRQAITTVRGAGYRLEADGG